MVQATWDEFTAGFDERDLALIGAFRAAATALPDVTEHVHRTEVQYKVVRVFTSAYVKSHWLEVAVDLLREVEHPLLKQAFPTTKRVITHRFTLASPDQVSEIAELMREARDTVGPGTR
ncbi:DUF5655 domain-containing protein [Leifsonia poae]|uniref:DUF5655 domain-containing protein n=1 Tax=Leifsonia poae TaxID=110933 RepID=A0A9W6HDF5_9MICO|nr:DUF5655 domain-containing protein [Leifsonia poae]GLJ77723.1 hypothetical protein GCM10017584_32970 [Leifsonia poae]